MCSLRKWINPTVKQTWVIFPVLLNKLSLGMCLGFTSCFLTAIKHPDSDIKMDIDTASWFVSSFGISVSVGYFIASCTMSKFGRRKTFVASLLPTVLGFAFTVFGTSNTLLILGRIVVGVSYGSNSFIGIIAVGEFSSTQNRGMFLNMLTATANIGILLVHVIGNYVPWRTLAILMISPMIISSFMAYTWPESPPWLAERKEYEKSRQAFYWLRGRTEETTREIEELIRAQGHKKIDKTVSENVKDFFLKFTKNNFLKPLLIIITSTLLLELSGRHIFPSYAAQLIKEMTTSNFDQFYYNIILDVLISISGFSASYLIRIMKMRTLLFSTGSVTFVMLMLGCLTLFFLKTGIISNNYSWIPLILIATYFVFTNLGCTCIPLALYGEIFPLEHRVVASAVSGYIFSIQMSIILKIMPYMVEACQLYGAFAIIAVCLALTLVVLYFILPETKGRTLQEIEDYFNYGKFRDGDLVPTDDKDCEPIKDKIDSEN